MIYQSIYDLIEYCLKHGLIDKDDKIYIRNRLLELFNLEDFCEDKIIKNNKDVKLELILKSCLDYAYENHLIKENTVLYRDLFDTKIMGILTPRPSEVIKKFNEDYVNSKDLATNNFYEFNKNVDYIRGYRIKKDLRWKIDTEYGKLDITINKSKPEKDPKDIAAAKNAIQSGYPKCLLCPENEGYSGRLNHPARQNLRIIPINLIGQEWGFQYSPYVYYNEHCIVLKYEHTPMVICEETFSLLLDFVRQFPHYFIGSNADLPIVGGSILSHNHFQGGNYEFAMAKAKFEKHFNIKGFEDVEVGIVKWPMSVIRIRHKDSKKLVKLATHILDSWRNYSDEGANIYSKTNGESHNTLTPIARMNNGIYELDIVLRNNRTTDKHPLGLFHPHENLHHIKKENIGLIEVMGLAVLPSRLDEEINIIKKALINNESIEDNESVKKHISWVKELKLKYYSFTAGDVDKILKYEIGAVFLQVLQDAGVYKKDKDGNGAFERFIKSL